MVRPPTLQHGRFTDLAAHVSDASLAPRARYAHLSSVTGHNLYIIGGQDYYNTWLDDICVFDLRAGRWVQRQPYNRHCGTYRSVAVSSPSRVRYPLDELPDALLGADHSDANPFGQPTCPDTPEATNARALVHLPYQDVEDPDSPSPPIDDDKPEGAEQHDSGRRPHGVGGSEIWVYSNYNVRTCGPRNAIFTLTRNPFLCTRACHPPSAASWDFPPLPPCAARPPISAGAFRNQIVIRARLRGLARVVHRREARAGGVDAKAGWVVCGARLERGDARGEEGMSNLSEPSKSPPSLLPPSIHQESVTPPLSRL